LILVVFVCCYEKWLTKQLWLQIGIEINHFPGIKDDVDFTEKMVKEQSVFCLPAKVKITEEWYLVFVVTWLV
jgi:tyrosine aminotransferase